MMHKIDLVKAVAKDAEISQRQANTAVDATMSFIADTLAKGDRVVLTGFGAFEPRHRAARKGRNPQTGESLTIPATTVPGFKAGKLLREAVKGETK